MDPELPSPIVLENVTLVRLRTRDFRDKRLSWARRPGSISSRLYFFVIYAELLVKMISSALRFKTDLIHCNDWFVLPIAVTLKFLTRAKLIYDAHELESETSRDANFPGSSVKFLERLVWNQIDFFTTVSPSINSWYQKSLGPKDFEIILNSPVLGRELSHVRDPGQSDDLRQKFSLSEATRVYIYVGMLSVGRGIETILEAFMSSQSNSVCVFMGYGSFEEKIKEAARISPKILLHERVAHDRVVRIASSADFGLCLIEDVSLSDRYCIPNKLLEYAFAGLPVVASRLPEISRIVETYSLGACFDNSVEELCNVLEKNSGELRIRNSVAPKLLFELSWEFQEQKLVKVFTNLID